MDMQSINPQAVVLTVAALTLLPLLTMVCTSFLKISVVLLIIRNALGIQQVPANMVIYSIALAATIFIMGPVFDEIVMRVQAVSPDSLDIEALYKNRSAVVEPLRKFLAHNTDPDTEMRLTEAAGKLWKKSGAVPVAQDSPAITLSAFVISELQSGFKTGFLVYIPFLAVDLIVSTVLMSLGMQMVAPMVISVPLKLLLFTLIDGWSRLLEGLFYSYL